MDNGHIEIHTDATTGRANWLRAAVLGADDGIVSLAALVVGVAGASVCSRDTANRYSRIACWRILNGGR
jgi:hypothetical protein